MYFYLIPRLLDIDLSILSDNFRFLPSVLILVLTVVMLLLVKYYFFDNTALFIKNIIKGVNYLTGKDIDKYFMGQSFVSKTSQDIYYLIVLDRGDIIKCILFYVKLDKLKSDLEQILKGFDPLIYDYSNDQQVIYYEAWKGHKLTESFLKENHIRQLVYKDGYLHKI